MSNSPAYYRARIEAFALALAYENTLPESREQKMRVCYLRNGFVPDGFYRDNELTYYNFKLEEVGSSGGSKQKSGGIFYFPSIDQYIKEIEHKYSNDALTPLDLHTLDTWFALHPEKVCGVQKGGSGFSFPVKTVGTKQDIINAIDATLNSEAKSNDNPKGFADLPIGTQLKSTIKDYGQTYTLQNVEGYKMFIGDKDGLPLQDGGKVLSEKSIRFIFQNELSNKPIEAKKTKASSTFKYKFEPGEKVLYKNLIEVTIIEPITAPTDKLMESYSVRFEDGLVKMFYADDLKKLEASEPKKSNLTLYKYKAKAISIKLKLLQA